MFILALKGLSNPRTARRANLLGAAGAALAILAYVLGIELRNLVWIIAAMAVGSVIAVIAARRVQMTQMPQLVAAFNGVGGGAAALVALVEISHGENPWTLGVVAFTVLIGGVSLTGSFVTFGKAAGHHHHSRGHLSGTARAHGGAGARRDRRRGLPSS